MATGRVFASKASAMRCEVGVSPCGSRAKRARAISSQNAFDVALGLGGLGGGEGGAGGDDAEDLLWQALMPLLTTQPTRLPRSHGRNW